MNPKTPSRAAGPGSSPAARGLISLIGVNPFVPSHGAASGKNALTVPGSGAKKLCCFPESSSKVCNVHGPII